jgi:Asp-tRNA(Asn)/Glu-tRNA(Gln) amidotransferase A subunit family amidase
MDDPDTQRRSRAMSLMRREGDFVPLLQGLPVGVQLVAAYGREDILIRVASQLEQANPWAHRTPDI